MLASQHSYQMKMTLLVKPFIVQMIASKAGAVHVWITHSRHDMHLDTENGFYTTLAIDMMPGYTQHETATI